MVNMLAASKRQNVVFNKDSSLQKFEDDLEDLREQLQLQNISRKPQNPRLLQIHFHTFRHWKATMLYHQTKDILYVMKFLGHKNIKNTLIYIQIEEAIFSREAEQYICRIAETINEAKMLIEAGFQYVCDFNGAKMFRKPKTLDLKEGADSGAGGI